jgi:hypothetical protein
VPPKINDVRLSVNGTVDVVEIVPLLVNVVPAALRIKVCAPITSVLPDAIVRFPLTVISPRTDILVPPVLLKLRLVYVLTGINCPPPEAANSTVPAKVEFEVEYGGFEVELNFNVPLFVSDPPQVKSNVDISNVVEAGIVNANNEIIEPSAVFVPLVLLNINVA